MSKIIFGTIAEIAAGIRDKEFSPEEVVEAHLEQIGKLQPKLNAFVHVDAEGARRQAEEKGRSLATLGMTGKGKGSGRKTRNPSLGQLFGVPVTVKSSIDVAGWPTSAGSLMRKDCVAQTDAPLVARLRAAGAIFLGNTNTPEFLMAYETDNSLSGKTSNPWNFERSSGGSSGGEAAAIASGCSAGGLGSDAGGSVRVPAHFCGICGLKPTPGRIPNTGHYPAGGGAFAWLGVVGPMARTIADVRTLFEVTAGPDAGDALSGPVPRHDLKNEDVRKTRIGILESDALGKPTAETSGAVERAAKLLSEQGFSVERKRINGLQRALEVWWYFFGPVIAHQIRKGSIGSENLMSPMLREFVALATAETSITADGLLNACAERDILRTEILQQMQDVPILLSPVSSAPAFRHGEGNWRRGEKENYRDTMRYTQWLNLTGFPGAVVPVGASPEGLPIGVQVIGRPYEEELVLAVAEAIERGRGAWQAPPI